MIRNNNNTEKTKESCVGIECWGPSKVDKHLGKFLTTSTSTLQYFI